MGFNSLLYAVVSFNGLCSCYVYVLVMFTVYCIYLGCLLYSSV